MVPAQQRDDEGPWLSIGALSKATGIAVETLRTWETRYGFPTPERKPSGHRVYPVSAVAAPAARRAGPRARAIARGRSWQPPTRPWAVCSRRARPPSRRRSRPPSPRCPRHEDLPGLVRLVRAFDADRLTRVFLGGLGAHGPGRVPRGAGRAARRAPSATPGRRASSRSATSTSSRSASATCCARCGCRSRSGRAGRSSSTRRCRARRTGSGSRCRRWCSPPRGCRTPLSGHRGAARPDGRRSPATSAHAPWRSASRSPARGTASTAGAAQAPRVAAEATLLLAGGDGAPVGQAGRRHRDEPAGAGRLGPAARLGSARRSCGRRDSSARMTSVMRASAAAGYPGP